jgi:hypothetical protein
MVASSVITFIDYKKKNFAFDFHHSKILIERNYSKVLKSRKCTLSLSNKINT